ncbi:MAG: Y-family DNA polymerase [Bacteroidia bacterium]|nr:Y-family DNA polymerase [Bacteroidia bacterium]
MFALIDCNNFYASCERLFQPKLRNLPVVILSNNDGCVISRSNEAKKLGIPMGAPAFEFAHIFEKENIQVFSSNYALYGDISSRVMATLSTFCPDMEVYSIDEAFLKFEGYDKHFNLSEIGKQIRYKVTRDTGIPVSVGFAPNKSLAKVANKIAKKFPDKTGNVYCINSDEKRIKALQWLSVGDVWGIGAQHAKQLKKLNVNTAYDFTLLEDAWVKKNMSIVGLRLLHELKGNVCLDLEMPANKQNIATTRSFEKNYTTFDMIRERVVTFAVTCAEKLRRQQSCANTLMVFIHTNRFRPDLPQYSRNFVMELPYPTNSNIELCKFATFALEKIYRNGFAYKKAGVIVMNITPVMEQQIHLFGNSNSRHKKLMEAVDGINKDIGHIKVKLAAQDLNCTWKMKQEKLSPRYSTRISEAIKVKA